MKDPHAAEEAQEKSLTDSLSEDYLGQDTEEAEKELQDLWRSPSLPEKDNSSSEPSKKSKKSKYPEPMLRMVMNLRRTKSTIVQVLLSRKIQHFDNIRQCLNVMKKTRKFDEIYKSLQTSVITLQIRF